MKLTKRHLVEEKGPDFGSGIAGDNFSTGGKFAGTASLSNTQTPTSPGGKYAGTLTTLGIPDAEVNKITVYAGPDKGFIEVDEDDERLFYNRRTAREAVGRNNEVLRFLQNSGVVSPQVMQNLTTANFGQTAVADGMAKTAPNVKATGRLSLDPRLTASNTLSRGGFDFGNAISR
jgi:hypothetical protein